MNLPAVVLEQFVIEFAAELAPLVAAELASTAPPAAEPWRLLTLEEAAARLGRSERSVREWVKRGELPHVRLDGGALAFELDDLRAFAEARRVAPGEGSVLAGRLQASSDRALGAGLRRGHQPAELRASRV